MVLKTADYCGVWQFEF